MKPGTYRLKRDMPALYPDKRMNYDWRAKDSKAGRLMIVEDIGPREGVEILRVYPSGSYAHYGERYTEEVFGDILEPVEETPVLWLKREFPSMSLAARALDLLVQDGTLTMEQVKAAVTRAYEE